MSAYFADVKVRCFKNLPQKHFLACSKNFSSTKRLEAFTSCYWNWLIFVNLFMTFLYASLWVHLMAFTFSRCVWPGNVTASSGTAISTDFATLTCSEILSKILIRCVTWHWACDCSFRCFHEIGRYFENKEQEWAKTRPCRHDRGQRRQEHPKIDSFWGANTGFFDFQHYATLCSGNRKNESFRLKFLVWCLESLRPSFLAVWFAIFVPVFMYFQWFWLYSVALALV